MPDYPKAVISTSLGDMTVELWNDVAPNHGENFLKLGSSGFYNNLTFHRIIPGFMVQGGCPKGDGTGGPGWNVNAEFNDREHQPGTLSMARSNDPDSAGSQFFICVDTAAHLDNTYTVFGKVRKGMDVVDKIVGADADGAGRPDKPVHIKKAKVTTGKADAGK